MRQTKIVALAIAVTAVGSVGVMGAQASQGDKVALCHGTASAKNPYVLISVDEHALAGHFDGEAPGHGKNNHPDFLLPAGSDDCSDAPEEEWSE